MPGMSGCGASPESVSRAVSSRANLPSLGGIELSGTETELTLRATDMELGLSVGVNEVTIKTSGTLLLPGRLFADVVRNLPHDLQPLLESGIFLCALAAVMLNAFFNGMSSKAAAEADAAAIASSAQHV